MIIGSATNLWVKTVNWLLQQDAKKLIFAIGGNASVMRRSQRVIYSLIQKHCDVSFIMTSAERLNTIKEGETLLQEFTTYSKIDAVFCVEMVGGVRRPICARINIFLSVSCVERREAENHRQRLQKRFTGSKTFRMPAK